jgi:putative transposase
MYPVVFFDALRVKIRNEATVGSKAIYLALAVLPDGHRDILGLWIEQTEGAEVLDEGVQRSEDPRVPGHPHRRHRRAERHERGASAALDAFERGPWGKKFPTVVSMWRRAWTHVVPFFAFAPDIRRLIYTTNALKAYTRRCGRSSKPVGSFRMIRRRRN